MAPEQRSGTPTGSPRPLRVDELERFASFCEAFADGIVVSDDSGVIVAANREIERLSGYEREELMGRSVEILIPAHLRGGHVSARTSYYLSPQVRPTRSHLQLWLRRRDGSDLAVDIGLGPIQIGDRRYVVSAVRDATERQRAQARASLREAILSAVAYAAHRFLRGGPWEAHIDDVLAKLGEAADLSRIDILVRHEDAAVPSTWDHRFEWCAPGVEPQIDDPGLRDMPLVGSGLDSWSTQLAAGALVHGTRAAFERFERTALEARGIHSLVLAPVFVDDRWWGAIAFIDNRSGREWSTGEMDALRAAADTLGAAVEREHASGSLQASEERFRLLAENAQDMLFRYRLIPTPGLEYVSPSSTAITGYTPEQHYGNPELFLEIAHPDDLHVIEESFASIAAGSEPPVTHEAVLRWVRKDGSVRWTELRNTPIHDADGHLVAVEGIARDVTEQKQAEAALHQTVTMLRETDQQRRRLLMQLVAAQEAERERIAADIHDDSIQQMTAVLLRLQVLRGNLQDTEQLELLGQLSTQIQSAIGRLRRLLFELRPPELQTEGLAGALRLYLIRWSVEWGGEEPIAFEVEDAMDREPSLETAAIAYRVAQEALVNVGKHAHARRVDIRIESRDGGLAVTIHDDGIGFEPVPDLESRPGHRGLSGMRDRAELSGGRFAVRSASGAGTIVELWLPLESAAGV